MTRDEFIGSLRDALKELKAEETEAVIAYYSEMIDDRVEAGMTEEAAVRAMEPVQVIAARVLSESDHAEAAEPEADETPEAVPEKIHEVVRDIAGVSEIHISAEEKRILFTSADTDTLTIRYPLEEQSVYQLHEEDGKLSLEHRKRTVSSFMNKNGEVTLESIFDNLSIENVLDGVGKLINTIGSVFTGSPDSQPVEVILPRSYCGVIRGDSKNARITLNGIICDGSVFLNTTNSRIVLENVTCKDQMVLNTSNARIQLNDVVVGKASLHTGNSSIGLEDVYAHESFDAAGSNGRIEARNVISDGDLFLSTSNGRVEIERLSARNIRIQTSNGGVSGSVCGDEAEFSVRTVTSNGPSNLSDHDGADKKLTVITSNGAVNITFESAGAEEAE